MSASSTPYISAAPFNSTDTRWMGDAISLAKKGLGRTSPNPAVGAVIIKNGTLVGQGYHMFAGGPHAEVVAIEDAGVDAVGATLYVTLEPCAHTGKTAPCVDLIVSTGIARVICAMNDPNPKVAGGGIAKLLAAGVEVEVGLLEKEARRINEGWLWWVTTGKPFVTLKWAQTLDGRTATCSGDSKWISSESSRRKVHQLRAASDAVLVGIGTVKADNPRLTVRNLEEKSGDLEHGIKQPKKTILDGRLSVPPDSRLFDTGDVLLICSEEVPQEKRAEKLAAIGQDSVQILAVGSRGGMLDLEAVLEALGEMEIVNLLVEGGAAVASSLLKHRLANRLSVFIAPTIMGRGVDAVGDLGLESMDQLLRLKDVSIEQIEDDFFISGLLKVSE